MGHVSYARRHRLLFAAVAVGAASLLMLVVLEVALAIAWRDRPRNDARRGGRSFAWGQETVGTTWGHEVRNNRYGFREGEVIVPKPPGTFRVLALGDSLTWGAGLAVEDRYTDRLEDLLRDHGVEVLNFARSGASTRQELEVLRLHLDEVQPDLVLVGFCFNDPQPRAQHWSRELGRFDLLFLAVAGLRRVGFWRSGRFLDQTLFDTLVGLGLAPPWEQALARAYAPSSAEWQGFVQALRELHALCAAHGLPPPVFAVLGQPLPEIGSHWPEQAAAAARAAGLMVVAVHTGLQEEVAGAALQVNPWDGHPSAACHEVYARRLAAAIGPLVRPR